MSTRPRFTVPVRMIALAIGCCQCGDTLLDHGADPALLALVCSPDLLACDGRCLSCAPPPNAQSVCAGDACGFECDPGYNRCSPDACVPEGTTSCGPSCSDCSGSAPANASAICSAEHACDFQCNPGFLRAGGKCQRAIAVSAGFEHTCALVAGGQVTCWGANDHGQLGNGSFSDSAIPAEIALPGPATVVAAGYEHTCAAVQGDVYCWGDNTFGEIGDGTMITRPTPVRVTGVSSVIGIAAGGGVLPGTSFGHTCAIIAGGSLECWGANGSGQLGDRSSSVRSTPVAVTVLPNGSSVGAVACGERHTCALAGGTVTCWGANDSGQLGTGGSAPQGSVATPAVASGASAVATGQAHTCALVGGNLQCWGLNTSGQVNGGNAALADVASPLAVAVGTVKPTIIATGRAHTCVVDGRAVPATALCFGANDAGQLGGAGSSVPVTLLPPSTASMMTAGADHTCLLTVDGGIQCWGANDRGQLGNGVLGGTASAPTYVSGR